MSPLRGMGIVVLMVVGVSGCAATPQRARTSSPMESPAVAAAPARPVGWRGWWSRWRNPTPAAAAAAEPAADDAPIEASRRVGPERDIWPDRSHGVLSRILPSGLKTRPNSGSILGSYAPAPSPKMTAEEANRAIASMARPAKKADDLVLPVQMTEELRAASDARPSPETRTEAEDSPTPSVLPAPIPLPGQLLDRYSTQQPSDAGLDPEARSPSAEASGLEAPSAGDVGLPLLASRETTPASAFDSPSVQLASATQVPPPPPVRPTPRPGQAPPASPPTPPAPPITETPPTAPPVEESSKPDAPAEPAAPSEAPAPAEPASEPMPEAPSPSLPVAPPASTPVEVAAPSQPAPAPESAPVVAASPTVPAPAPAAAPVAATTAPTPRRWSLLSWFRPRSHEASHTHSHPHRPTVFPSPQGPAPLPPVLVPTSYHAQAAAPSAPSPTAEQAFLLPSPQGPPPSVKSEEKKECVLLTRLHNRMDQYRQWKHAHVCKHIQSFKDALAGKHRCSACGGTGVAPLPSAQAGPSPQESPAVPATRTQAQVFGTRSRLDLLAETGHVAEGEQVVERVAAQGLDEAPKR